MSADRDDSPWSTTGAAELRQAEPAAVGAPPSKPALSKADLQSRGWTPHAIARFLGDPDSRRRVGWGEEHLYRAPRIVEAESNPAFMDWKRSRDARGERAKKAANRAARALAEAARTWTPRIARLPIEEVRRRAIAAYNYRLDHRAVRASELHGDAFELPPPADESSPDEFLLRITVNYVRHQMTTYDGKLKALQGQPGGHDAEPLLRQRVFEVIAEVYPELADEARRQLSAREGSSK